MSREISRREFLIVGLTAFTQFVAACDSGKSTTVLAPRSTPLPPEPTAILKEPSITLAISLENPSTPSASKAIESFREKHHYWETTDLATSKYVNDKTRVLRSKITFPYKLPFYNKGAEPLGVVSHRITSSIPGVPGIGVDTILMDDFGQFRNFYVYDQPFTVVGAQTYGTSNNLLAEAFLEYPPREIINTPQAHFYLHEVHYDKRGKIQFIAKSEIDRVGIKIKEVESEGEKKNEYYFFFNRV